MRSQTNCLIFFLAAAVLLASCAANKKVAYFEEVQQVRIDSLPLVEQALIQKNDILSISVSSLNPEASAVFNMPNLPPMVSANSSNSGSLSQSVGYLVNEDGRIEFPMLGSLQAAGLTKKQLAEEIRSQITEKQLLKDPIIAIRQLNFHVTVLGEVGHPTVVNVPGEKINILEALGMAGDLTIYGRRDNVLLIREENGIKTTRRLDLNSNELLTSPYYYLKSNDIVYAQPTKAKVSAASNSRQVLPMVFSGLSFLAIVIDRLVK